MAFLSILGALLQVILLVLFIVAARTQNRLNRLTNERLDKLEQRR
jgi:hypothetical protein